MVKKAAHATPNRRLRAARKERGWTQQQVADRIGAPLALNISRWENGTAFPSPYYLERLCQLFGKSISELGLSQYDRETQEEPPAAQPTSREPLSSSQVVPKSQPEAASSPSAEGPSSIDSVRVPPVWLLPSLRNPFFLGREEVLARLRHQLLAGQTMALSPPQALSGLGGVGKTQVALEYAYRHANDYQAVLWTRADSRDALVTGYGEIAQALLLPERDEQDQAVMIEAVKSWLRQHTGWLLILDNADELAMLPEFLPAPTQGHVLLTTRAQAVGQLATRIEVEILSDSMAALLLLRRAGLLALDVPLAHAEPIDQQAAGRLAEALGGLPLALDQAGAYLEETGCSLTQYLDLYQNHRNALLRHRGEAINDHPDSVATSLALSFASVQGRSALAADLLRVCAVLHPDAIPEELLQQGADSLGPALSAMQTDPLALDLALSVIGNYSLLRRNNREHTLWVHRLVQAVLTEAMTPQEHTQWAKRAVAALNTVFPQVRNQVWGQWERCSRLLLHVLTVTQAPVWQEPSLELGCLLAKTADYLFQRTQYSQAEPLYQRALSLLEQMLGKVHPQVAFPLNGLADLYREQGRYEQAEPLYQRALHLWETLGQTHPEVPSPLNNLAILYSKQSKYKQAVVLLQRDVHLKEQKLGSLHPKLASPLNNLAILYCEQGRYEQAEPLLQQALSIDEQAFGQEHPETSYSLNNLAAVYREQGRYEEAEPLYQRVLAIREQALGHEHLLVTFPLNGLADLYREQGRYSDAELLYQRSLAICEQTLGESHPQVAFPLNGLATLYREQGHYAEAEALYQRALAIRQQQLGAHHPETAESLHDFACLQEERNQPDQALRLYRQALHIREQRLGREHPHTQATSTRYRHLLQACTATRKQERIELAQQPAPAAQSITYPDGLTTREVEVLRLVAQGLRNAEIADHLVISLLTVKAHMRSLYNKLSINSRSAATRYAIEHHLV